MDYIYAFLILFFLSILIFSTYKNEEGFTPGIRELYRPHLRNTRVLYEGFYNTTKQNVTNVFRKFGLM